MLKPSKKTPGSPSPQTSTTTPRSPSPLTGTHSDPTLSVSGAVGGDPISTAHSSIASPGTSIPRASVIINRLPDPQPSRHTATVARTQDTPPPHQVPVVDTSLGDRPKHPVFIDDKSAAQLKRNPATSEGIRYDKFKKAYVEMEGGIVMVRKDKGGYRQTHAGESSPSGEWVEQIPDTTLWRQIEPVNTPSKRPLPEIDQALADTPEVTAGPSKRFRVSDETHVATDAGALVQNLFHQQTSALDLSLGQWKNWGKSIGPETGESVEIDGQHYVIVSQGLRPETGLVYLQHPAFVPDHFDAFENMLRDEPSRQPKWALKRDGQWKVLDNHPPFTKPLTQYVCDAFNYLSEHSASAVARAVFTRASRPEGINAHGISVMALTLRHWTDRVTNEKVLHSLSDPLVMLPKLQTQPSPLVPGGLLTLPARGSDLLQRLDFDPQRFPQEWGTYTAAPTSAGLHNLFSFVLQQSGYSINPSTRQHSEDALIFHRQGVAAVFVLKLPRFTGDTVPRSTTAGSELTNPVFRNKLKSPEKEKLDSYLAQNEIVYLIGGVQESTPYTPTLFVVREG
ncbi:hypothetical protein [Pseudomonas sp. EA_65y_Pfl2_P74]|uniref:hypothetical protein n=1 Tax=Pseudomonas sp. EA_65y_Pfl2_P74 TaxID=3088694 RepID=UPI0030DD1229